MRKQINEGYQEKRDHAIDVIEYYDCMTSEGHVLSPEQREQLTDVVAFLKDTDDGSNPVTNDWIKLGRAVLKRNANKWKGGSMIESHNKLINIDKCVRESVNKVLNELDNYVAESVRKPVNETAEDDWNDIENADEDTRYEMGEFTKAMQKENGTYKASSKDGKFNTGDKVIVHLRNGNDINGVISDIDTNFMTYEEQFDIDYVDENGTKKTLICVPASKVEKVLKEEVDMGQVPAVSDKRSTAADIPDNVRKEIRKLRQQIGEFDDEGKDTTELQKRLKDLKNKYCS